MNVVADQVNSDAIDWGHLVARGSKSVQALISQPAPLIFQMVWPWHSRPLIACIQSGQATRQDAAASMLYAAEAAVIVAHQVVQAMGKGGFMNESLLSRAFRNMKLMETGMGASESRRMPIGREMMGKMG